MLCKLILKIKKYTEKNNIKNKYNIRK